MHGSRRRLIAWATVIAFAATFGLPFVSPQHAWVNDPDSGWDGPLLLTGHPVAQFESVVASRAGEHCAICHWMRALGSSVAGIKARRPDLAPAVGRRIEPIFVVAASPAESGPARGPPSSLA